MKPKQLIIGAAGVGLLAYFLFPKQAKALIGSGNDFETFQGVRFWRKDAMDRVKDRLRKQGIKPDGSDDLPMSAEIVASGTPETALQWVARKQAGNWFVASTDNLLTGPSSEHPSVFFVTVLDIESAKAIAESNPRLAFLPPVG